MLKRDLAELLAAAEYSVRKSITPATYWVNRFMERPKAQLQAAVTRRNLDLGHGEPVSLTRPWGTEEAVVDENHGDGTVTVRYLGSETLVTIESADLTRSNA